MKRFLGIVCMFLAVLPSFGQTVQWTDINYAGDSLEGHKLDICLPDGNSAKHKVVVLIYGSAFPICSFMYVVGETPYSSLKAVEKLPGFVKPVSSAISLTE